MFDYKEIEMRTTVIKKQIILTLSNSEMRRLHGNSFFKMIE